MAKITGKGALKAGPAAVRGYGATVTSVRDTALVFDPYAKIDLDHLIDQLDGLSNDYLRAVVADPEGTCETLGMLVGNVPDAVVTELAKGMLEDRSDGDKEGFELWKVFVVGVVTLAVGLLLGFITPK
ncbi:MAG: hypothetical protein AAGI27_03575 [Pseudomonadota bacterium]